MHEIQVKRGRTSILLKKVPYAFGVRLYQGRAHSEKKLSAGLGISARRVKHVNSRCADNMEIFAVKRSQYLDQAMDHLRKAGTEVVTHVYDQNQTKQGDGEWMIPTGTMLVQFQENTKFEDQSRILTDAGLEVMEDLDYIPRGYTVRLTETARENPLKLAHTLTALPEIEIAEADLGYAAIPAHRPADTLYRKQWYLHNPGGAAGLTAGADVKSEEAWEYTRGSRSISICIIDDAFDLTHRDFAGPGKIIAPMDFYGDDFAPHPDHGSQKHGTACAGLALAAENSYGIVGLAPACAFMPVRRHYDISDLSLVALFRYAMQNNADVISCSWLAQAWNAPLHTRVEQIITQAAREGRQGRGCVICFAAGNENRPLNAYKDDEPSVQGFGCHPDAITVGACNSLDRRSHYSNYGAELDLCAPSSGRGGRSIFTTDINDQGGYTSGDFYHKFGGTSAATPLVAGLAGLMLSIDSDMPAAEVKKIMMKTADKIDPHHGNYRDGHSDWYGYGRINAGRAVQTVYERRSNQQLRLSSPKVAIMPGHGGSQTGAINTSYDAYEKDYNWREALELAERLKDAGYQVLICRQENADTTAAAMQQRANQFKADLCLCLHHNAFSGHIRGWGVYYAQEDSRALAELINHRSFPEALSIPPHGRGPKLAGTRQYPRVYNCLKFCTMPAVLLESCFIDHNNDCQWLINGGYLQVVTALYNAVTNYLPLHHREEDDAITPHDLCEVYLDLYQQGMILTPELMGISFAHWMHASAWCTALAAQNALNFAAIPKQLRQGGSIYSYDGVDYQKFKSLEGFIIAYWLTLPIHGYLTEAESFIRAVTSVYQPEDHDYARQVLRIYHSAKMLPFRRQLENIL